MMQDNEHLEVISRGVHIGGGRILLCHTKGATNTYLPGGHVDFGESSKTALSREIEEELGLTCNVRDFMGVVEHMYEDESGKHCEINLVFRMDIPDLTPDQQPVSREDYIEFLWADTENIEKSRLEPASLCGCLREWISRTGGDGFRIGPADG